MTTKERLTNLLIDNGIDPRCDEARCLISDEMDTFDASTEVILEMNSRINKLERHIYDMGVALNARR